MNPPLPYPEPIALCLEDLGPAPGVQRFVRCVALAGRQPGLGLDRAGELRWQAPTELACELWVSADARLVLFRPNGAEAAVRLHRAERLFEVPEGKPVFVLDGDEVEVGPRRLRLHVHGIAPAVRAPAPLEPERPARAARVAAVVAIGAAVIGCENKSPEVPRPVEVREQPPAAPQMDPWPPASEAAPEGAPDGGVIAVDPGPLSAPAGSPAAGPASATGAEPKPAVPKAAPPTAPPIEVREAPPDVAVE